VDKLEWQDWPNKNIIVGSKLNTKELSKCIGRLDGVVRWAQMIKAIHLGATLDV
jgi:hypothetical protein